MTTLSAPRQSHGFETPSAPQHSLHAFPVALELVRAVHAAKIRRAHLRDQCERAAESCAANVAEGAGRVSRADKARVFAVARGECTEACGVAEVALAAGATSADAYARIARVASHRYAMLTKLAR